MSEKKVKKSTALSVPIAKKKKKKRIGTAVSADAIATKGTGTQLARNTLTTPITSEAYCLRGQDMSNVRPLDLAEFAETALREYGSYVVEERAVSDFRDGLKPVHRAVIWAMNDLSLRPSSGHKKAARTVGQAIGMYHPHGDCLGHETQFVMADGSLCRLGALYLDGKRRKVRVFDQNAGQYVTATARDFRIGQYATKIYKIYVTGSSEPIRCTGNHPFLSADRKWIKAEDLKEGQLLYGTNDYGNNPSILLIDVHEHALPEPMYDFTVDYHENAAIQVGGTQLVVHNSSTLGAMVTIANTIPPLVDGAGNWGTPTASHAAGRYIEAKMSKFCSTFMLDPKYLAVVPTIPNYSNDGQIPLYFPALLPFLMFNGCVPAPAYGVKAGNPTFSFESVVKVVMDGLKGKDITAKYLAKTLEVEHEYGCQTVPNESGFLDFMATGNGKVTYKPVLNIDVKKKTITVRTFVPGGFASSKTINKKLEKLAAIQGVSQAYAKSGLKNQLAGPWGSAYDIKCGRVSEDRLFEIAQEVMKEVTASVTYNLGVTIRHAEKRNEFKYLSYVTYFKAWLVYRINLEKRMNKELIEKAERALHLNKVYLFAVDNLKTLLAALPKVLAAESPDVALAKALKMSEEDAKIILDRQIRKLAKLERTQLVDIIKGIEADIKTYRHRYDNAGQAAADDTAARVKSYLKAPDHHPYNEKKDMFCYRKLLS